MQFDFNAPFRQSNMRQSKGIQDILFQLQNRSDHGSNKHEEVDFSNFGEVEEQKSVQKSYTSEMFNKPKQPSIPESKQKQESQFQHDTSRDIGQISYLYSNNQSFRFERSLSFQAPQNKQSQRFQKLKSLLSKAKKNNLDAFYKNIDQAANQNTEGNRQFRNKNQFKEFTLNMRVQKRQQQAQFQKIVQQKKLTNKTTVKNITAYLFGAQAAEAFKKKQVYEQNFLPPEYTQQEQQNDSMDFFNNSKEHNNQQNHHNEEEDMDFFAQKKQQYFKQGQQFFDIDGQKKPASNKLIKTKVPLDPIRQERHTILDHSLQEKKFQDLVQNYSSMKNNYNLLMQQLKQTSKGQFQLMDEMQKIKHDYNAHQTRHQQSRTSSTQQKKHKQEEKQKLKHIKQQQLAQIKNQIHEIKATSTEKDVAYLKINEKIEQLEQIVRAALQEVQQQKIQKQNFTPKVINYFGSKDDRSSPRTQRQEFEQQLDQASLSRDSQNIYEVNRPQRVEGYSNSLPRTQTIEKQQQKKSSSRMQSRGVSNMQSHVTSIRREQPQKSGYVEKNSLRDQLNFIDQFSSPLQLDLSVDANNLNNASSQLEQQYEIDFNPPDHALEYLPLKLDQADSKNLRNILTQKSSILYQSFEFLITVRYTMQNDQMYPVIGSLRVSNKCAIDLLDVFIIVYGPQGQNVEISPNKIFQQRLKFNSNIFFQVKLNKNCIEDNGFNVQVCYKTDSITKKKINFKALLPIIQLIRPQFCYQENFLDSWDLFKNQIYIKPRRLNFKQIRNHEDLKLVLPFIHISEQDPNTFSYGLMFRYPKSKTMFMLKICCYVNGRASVHLRGDKNGDLKLKQELLNIISYLFLI